MAANDCRVKASRVQPNSADPIAVATHGDVQSVAKLLTRPPTDREQPDFHDFSRYDRKSKLNCFAGGRIARFPLGHDAIHGLGFINTQSNSPQVDQPRVDQSAMFRLAHPKGSRLAFSVDACEQVLITDKSKKCERTF